MSEQQPYTPGMALATDPAVLAREAANFERIADGLKDEIARVEQIAAGLDSKWQGLAAKAAQQALARFQQAADAHVRELNDISTNVHAAGVRYSAVDEEQAQALAAKMGMGDQNGESSKDGRGKVGLIDHHTFKDGPGRPFPERPWEYNIDLTSSDILKDQLTHPSAGSGISIDDVWNELHRCFNCNFPIGGAPTGFPKIGDELPLEIRTAGKQLVNLPVKVTQIEKTASELNIEFATVPGHVDGPGSTIHFRFFNEGGELHLGVRGYITEGPGSEPGPLGVLPRVGYTEVARLTWQPYIDRLTENIAKAHGHVPIPIGDLPAPRNAQPPPFGPHYEPMPRPR